VWFILNSPARCPFQLYKLQGLDLTFGEFMAQTQAITQLSLVPGAAGLAPDEVHYHFGQGPKVLLLATICHG
jgi:hypothetical protein